MNESNAATINYKWRMKMSSRTQRVKGDIVRIPTLEELESVGWEWYIGGKTIYHPDFEVPNYMMGEEMRKWLGKTVTITGIDATVKGHNLYGIEEDGESWRWCFDFFDELLVNEVKYGCPGHEEGMYPIDNWFICKHCGDNLREIK